MHHSDDGSGALTRTTALRHGHRNGEAGDPVPFEPQRPATTLLAFSPCASKAFFSSPAGCCLPQRAPIGSQGGREPLAGWPVPTLLPTNPANRRPRTSSRRGRPPGCPRRARYPRPAGDEERACRRRSYLPTPPAYQPREKPAFEPTIAPSRLQSLRPRQLLTDVAELAGPRASAPVQPVFHARRSGSRNARPAGVKADRPLRPWSFALAFRKGRPSRGWDGPGLQRYGKQHPAGEEEGPPNHRTEPREVAVTRGGIRTDGDPNAIVGAEPLRGECPGRPPGHHLGVSCARQLVPAHSPIAGQVLRLHP